MREMRAGFRSTTSSCYTPASGGISTKTGRGRPVRICLNASNTASGISRGLIASRCHFVTPRTAPGWSSISCTAPRPLPIAPRGIWPAMRRHSVVEREKALVRPAAALYSPGTRNHKCDSRFSGCVGISIGHIYRRLFVPSRYHANTWLVPQTGHNTVYLYARDSRIRPLRLHLLVTSLELHRHSSWPSVFLLFLSWKNYERTVHNCGMADSDHL